MFIRRRIRLSDLSPRYSHSSGGLKRQRGNRAACKPAEDAFSRLPREPRRPFRQRIKAVTLKIIRMIHGAAASPASARIACASVKRSPALLSAECRLNIEGQLGTNESCLMAKHSRFTQQQYSGERVAPWGSRKPTDDDEFRQGRLKYEVTVHPVRVVRAMPR